VNSLAPALRGASVRRVKSKSGQLFECIAKVSVLHSYYDTTGGACPDFKFFLTDESAELTKSLGLIFKPERCGFSILLDRRRQSAFFNYLAEQDRLIESPGDVVRGEGPWTRLSFSLAVQNANFVNITDMPIDTSALYRVFYLSNLIAVSTGTGKASLHSGRLTDEMKVSSTGSVYTAYGDGLGEFKVVNIAGDAAMVLYPPLQSPSEPFCSPIYLDLSSVIEGKYVIDAYTFPLPGSLVQRDEVVYIYSAPSPMIFLDLIFCQPPSVSSGVYPVIRVSGDSPSAPNGSPSSDEFQINPTEFFISLDTRSTIWNYYIVSTGQALTNLQIETISPKSSPAVTFSGPTSVRLANGQSASLFVSDTPLPLLERSTLNFQLRGQVGGLQTRNGVLMNRLPVASSRQVIPLQGDFAVLEPSAPRPISSPDDSLVNYSDIYVYV
jgi:hypothetical protein